MAGAFVVAATAAGCLLKLLLLEDNHYLYVAEYTGPGLAWIYRVAALWGGNAGSLLFWVLILTLYGAMVSWSRHDDSERMLPWVAWILSALTLFYAVILNVAVAPFARSAEPIPMSGLNPLLQNPGMTIHPVNLYLGFIGFSIPFAYSISSLILGKTDATWLVVTRRWTLASWLFLSIGILYGAHWSYEELGWGGYWAWDPVENAALLPWLTATAFLHSAIVQERRHMLTRWNHVLVILTFWLTVLGTYLTRSGVIWSIHAFTNSALGAYFLALLMAVGAASCAILIWRWRVLRGGPPMTAVVSRESAFVFNNVLLVGCTAGVLLGTIFPLLTGWLDGAEKVVDNGYYNGVILPLAVCVLILMGMGPLLPWRHTTWRLARRAVGYPLAAAVVIGLALALVLYMPAGRLPVLGTSALVAAVFVVASVLLEYAQIGRLVKGASARVTTGGALRWMRTERRRLGDTWFTWRLRSWPWASLRLVRFTSVNRNNWPRAIRPSAWPGSAFASSA
ncbi:hypothetical protein GCM10025857_37840 [Alicyclobacillus contaminans]|nr:hypothetical protein GCM10025857_37840 [Alicyclobacillus contaminans]